MAFIHANIKLPAHNISISTELYFPTDLPDAVGNKIRGVITLLHGFSNTGRDWMMYTAAPRYAADNGYVLVAPSMENSFYQNMAFGPAYHTILASDLPKQLRAIFRLPDDREMNFIAGLSMGGYGALHCGLTFSDRYAAIGSFSGCTDIRALLAAVRAEPHPTAISLQAAFGNDLSCRDDQDLFYLLQKVAGLPKKQRPRIYISCGEQDTLPIPLSIAEQNDRFAQMLSVFDMEHRYDTWPGIHEFSFWDRSFAEFIGFIQNNDYAFNKGMDWTQK